MPEWSDDLSGFSLDEVFSAQAANREWHKELRQRVAALTTSRLANNISWVEYMADRKLAHEDAAECKRRAMILEQKIARRCGASLPL
jgi:hypothetical protein